MFKNFTSKKTLAALAFAMICGVSYAQTKSVTLTQAGTIESKITDAEKLNITELTVKGPINGTDILFIREMAGRGNAANKSTKGKLQRLNLQEASITKGGKAYFTIKRGLSFVSRSVSADNLVDHDMFNGCDKLVEVKLPANVQKINNNAFQGCTSLEVCNIPAAVDYLGDYAFADCKALKKADIPSSVANTGGYVFNKCEALQSVTFGEESPITEIRTNSFNGCTSLTSVKLPSSVEKIGSKAFANCSSLTTFTLPAAFIENAADAFQDTPIKHYDVEDGIEGYTSVDGVLYNEDQSELLLYPAGRTEDAFIVPGSVYAINEQAFSGATNLKHITLPQGLTNIEKKAFANSGLTEIVCPAEVTSIEAEAFSGCKALATAKFEGGMQGIGDRAFFGTALTSVTFNVMNTLPELGKNAFQTLNTTAIFFVPANKVADFKTALIKAEAVSPERFEVKDLATTAISTTEQDLSSPEVARYNAAGQRISAPVRGLNIVKMANGRVVKRIER